MAELGQEQNSYGIAGTSGAVEVNGKAMEQFCGASNTEYSDGFDMQ